MADTISKSRRSANMSRIRSTGTQPEMIVRRMSHALGYRHRLHQKALPGKPDLVYPSRKAAIFVHGCFWHQHPSEMCLDARLPKSRPEYWLPKLERNVERDARVQHQLYEMGWRVLVIWDCETKEIAALKERLCNFLD